MRLDICFCGNASIWGQGACLLGSSVAYGKLPVAPLGFRISVQFRRVTILYTGTQDGGTRHRQLNTPSKPIADKYLEGNMKSTLGRGLRAFEIAGGQLVGTSLRWQDLLGDLARSWCSLCAFGGQCRFRLASLASRRHRQGCGGQKRWLLV